MDSKADIATGLTPPPPPRRRERYRALFDCVADSILVFERPGYRCVECNEKALETYGYSRQEFLSLYVTDLHPPDEHDRVRLSLAAGLSQETRMYRHLTKSGDILDVEIRSAEMEEPGGRLTVSIVRDVTERLHEERTARELEKRLQQMQRLTSVGALAGGVAHEFNNLLTVVIGNVSLLRGSFPVGSPDYEALADIQGSAMKATELTSELLAFAEQKPKEGQADISDLFAGLETLMATVVAKQARLEFDIAADTPQVSADPSQIKQLLLNLVVNASESLKDGRGSIRVRAGTMEADRKYLDNAVLSRQLPAGEYVYLEVTDSGSGIRPEVLPHIFDPFYTTKFVGRGLGLSTAVGIVRSLGGALFVSSQVGYGSTFQVLLSPARVDSPGLEATEPTAEDQPVVAAALVPPRLH